MSKNTILTVGIFLLIVGGITWAIQYMPNWRVVSQPPPPPTSERKSSQEVLRFSRPAGQTGTPIRGVFELNENGEDSGYVLESEMGVPGHYDFPFRNMLDVTAELEVLQSDCDCTQAEVCLVPETEWLAIDAQFAKAPWVEPPFRNPPAWHKLTKNEHVGFAVPPKGHGVLRIEWSGRKGIGEMLKINLKFWSKAQGDSASPQIDQITVPVGVVPPILYDPQKASGILLGSGDKYTAEFYCWSTTRDKPDVSFQPREPDPLFTVESRPLSEAECKDLQRRMLDDRPKSPRRTRVRSGFLVKATVHEQSGGRQMDQGPFTRIVPIFVDEIHVDYHTPSVSGVVKGIVEVGGSEDHGKVNFKSFSAADGKIMIVPLYADPKLTIEQVSRVPEALKVELHRRTAKDSTAQRAQWDLKVTVPPGAWSGALPENSSIVLRALTNPPRLVRIPVTGVATR